MSLMTFTRNRLMSLAGVIMAQGFTTVAGALAGLMVVRSLAPESYAQYSLALAVLGTISVLADGGTTMGAMAEGGKVWGQPKRLAVVLGVAWALRKRFGLWACGVSLPVLGVLLWRHGAAWWEIAVWSATVALLFSLNMRGALLEVPLRLAQSLRVTQGAAVGQSLLRLGAVGVTMFFLPVGIVAALAGGLPQAWTNWRFKLAASSEILAPSQDPLAANSQKPEASEAREVRGRFMGLVKRTLPGAMFYVVSQQAGTWLLGAAGTTLALAQLGALGRISLLLSVIGALSNAVWVPRMARITDNTALRPAYFRYLGLAAALCVPLGAVALVWPTGLLWLVGPAYEGLESSLQLAMGAAVLNVLGGIAFYLAYGRGWLPLPVIGIGSAVAVQGLCIWLLDVKTLDGVIYMSAGIGLHSLVLHVWYFLYRTRNGALS